MSAFIAASVLQIQSQNDPERAGQLPRNLPVIQSRIRSCSHTPPWICTDSRGYSTTAGFHLFRWGPWQDFHRFPLEPEFHWLLEMEPAWNDPPRCYTPAPPALASGPSREGVSLRRSPGRADRPCPEPPLEAGAVRHSRRSVPGSLGCSSVPAAR